ncbi:MAG TPA: hypothetical protein VLV83_08835 [Acidobacteriota bacterium]|nr:hypothetical protein [Acidobacteriota bacterium]
MAKPSKKVEEQVRSVKRVCRGREGACGYDFNETILSNPLDGKVRDYECPQCGQKGSYRAPLFE